MPLILICGYPSCGKTTFAKALAASLQQWLGDESKVILINEESENLSKREGYKNSASEKLTRGTIKSAVNVALSAENYVIVDSLNYIKGFRYEIFCISRSLRTPQCVCWVEANEADAFKWNHERGVEESFDDHILADLKLRFEPPSEKNRWDSPLFRVFNKSRTSDHESDSEAATLKAVPSKAEAGAADEAVALPTEDTAKRNEIEIVLSEVISPSDIEASDEVDTTAPPTAPPKPVLSSWRSKAPAPQQGDRKGTSSAKSVFTTSSWRSKHTNKSRNNDEVNDDDDATSIISATSTAATTTGPSTGGGALSFSGSLLKADGLVGMTFEAAVGEVKTFFSSASAPAPNSSTISVPRAHADLLHELDRVSQAVVQTIVAHQRDNVEGTPIMFTDYKRTMTLHRYVGLAELQRLRRMFVKSNGQSPPASALSIGSSFIDFLANQL